MSEYQVIATKFRPHTFAGVVGQDHIIRTLQNAIKLERISQAFLFTGTRGCGKTSTARILAKALNCSAGKGPQEEPCNQCDTCHEITSGSSLDVLEIDGASNNSVDNVRELRDNVRFMPNRGRYRIYIIDEAHMLSNAAWNALLKTLEEPPKHVIFIFATTEPQKVPQTILSRCQRFDFKRIPASIIAKRLKEICKKENIKLSDTGLAALAEAAEGSLRDGQSLLDQLATFSGKAIKENEIAEILGLIDRSLLSEVIQALVERNAASVLDVTRRVVEAGYDIETFAREILSRVRDLMVVKTVPEPEPLLDRSLDEIEALVKQANTFTREEIDALFSILSAAMNDLRGELGYLTLEMALLRMVSVEPLTPLVDLVEQIEHLAQAEPVPRTQTSTPTSNVLKQKTRPQSTQPAPRSPATEKQTASTPPPKLSTSGALIWDEFVLYVKNRAGFLGSYLADAWMESFDGKTLTIGVRMDSLSETQLKEESRQNALAEYLQGHLGIEASIRVTSTQDTNKPSGQPTSEKKTTSNAPGNSTDAERKQLREDALANPDIKRAMQTLGAELTDVRPIRTEGGN